MPHCTHGRDWQHDAPAVHWALRWFWLVVAMSRGVQVAAQDQCQLRNCLPPDDTQDPPICYKRTGVSQYGPGAQSFGTCPANLHCSFCSSLPCESRCQVEKSELRPLGAECYFDEECDGIFARCLQRVCKNALLTHQACDTSNDNDVCVTGQKSCFRGKCQGLSSGKPCNAHPEGRDIECNPGWYCFLGVCSPQLPRGHTCAGLHPSECVRGFRCNLALFSPKCTQEYSLTLGELSSEARLCRSNHMDPRIQACAEMPPLEMRNKKPLVSGRDCSQDSDCPRADTSIGVCLCKQWWEGLGQSGYCELTVADPGRPAFKRFWEASGRLCHHDWSEERCAVEIDMEDVLEQIRQERKVKSVDPTEVKECAKLLITDDFVETGGAPSRSLQAGAVIKALGILHVIAGMLM